MSGRVQKDAEALAARLVGREYGAEAEKVSFGSVEIVDAEIQVEPARSGGVWPRARPMVGDTLKVQTSAVAGGEFGPEICRGR